MTFDSIFEQGFFNFISLAVFTVILCAIISGLLVRQYERHKKRINDDSDTRFLTNTIRLLVWTVGILSVLSEIRPLKPLGDTLLGASGILAIGFSIAAQTAFSNYIAGFMLAIHKPFRVGDSIYLKEQKEAGIVKEITFRHTVIMTKTGTLLTIPNASMNDFMIEDLSNTGYAREVAFKVGGETKLEAVRDAVYAVLKDKKLAINKTPRIVIDTFDGEGYTVAVTLTAGSMGDYAELKNAFIPELIKTLKEKEITVV